MGTGAEEPGSSQRTVRVKVLSSLVKSKKSLKGFFKTSTIRSLTEINFFWDCQRDGTPPGGISELCGCLVVRTTSGHVEVGAGVGRSPAPPIASDIPGVDRPITIL